MEKTNNVNPSIGINFNDFLSELFRRKFVVIALILASVLVSFFYTKLFVESKYTSQAKIYVFNSAGGQMSSSELSIATYLAKDYSELIIDRTVLNEVNKRLDLGYSYGRLKSMVTVNNPQSTRILEISVRADSPKEAQKIADEICLVAQEKIVEIMEVDRVNIYSKAYLPGAPDNNNVRQNVFGGFWVGTIIAALFVLFCYYRNDKISGSEDIQKYLGLCTLGTIPYNQTMAQKNGRSKAVRAKNGR